MASHRHSTVRQLLIFRDPQKFPNNAAIRTKFLDAHTLAKSIIWTRFQIFIFLLRKPPDNFFHRQRRRRRWLRLRADPGDMMLRRRLHRPLRTPLRPQAVTLTPNTPAIANKQTKNRRNNFIPA